MKNKEQIKNICIKYIHREGVKDLLDWLDDTDFYTAPASTKFHLNIEGGLCEHSLNVLNRLLTLYNFRLNNNEIKTIDNEEVTYNVDKELIESIVIVALFHDLCKVNFYEEHLSSYNEIYYTIYNQGDLYGHGHKSAHIVSKFLRLNDKEYTAIVYHMGFTSDEPKTVNEVFNNNDLAVNIHLADMQATFLDERKKSL